MCFSGRGGEILAADGTWSTVSRETIKQRFRDGAAECLICTDAAAEGLNFQFCGALVNYDMPWNPMKVEQRIGRIDRLGQRHKIIRIVNLHYSNTVEADVYTALGKRINLFRTFVGKLQPILSKLPAMIAEATLRAGDRELGRSSMVSEIEVAATAAEADSFDLDAIVPADLEQPVRPSALYDLADLEKLLASTDLLPPGLDASPLEGSNHQFKYAAPGVPKPIRVTIDPAFFDEHPESVELWSPGSPVFPDPEEVASVEDLAANRGALARIFRHLRP